MMSDPFSGSTFDFDGDTGQASVPAVEPTYRKGMTAEDIQRWAAWVRPFPLPEHMTPAGTNIFANVDDETLLIAPPHLIVHMQRTAAQNGLQIISPRQIPVTCMLGRTVDPQRDIGDMVVGSVAARDTYWPTLDDDWEELDRLLPDEPMPVVSDRSLMRTRTRTTPLVAHGEALSDPVLACLVKGRAVIDILRRDDVSGDADTMTSLLADAWGVDEEEISELDAYSLGIEGDMLRHAIRADDVYPAVNAPIHKKLCVAVGHSEVTRDLLPEDAAMDWRRMRVVAESVFLSCCSLEAIPLAEVMCIPAPGDPNAPLNRPNILAFRPFPCTAWSFEARSFSICPTFSRKRVPNTEVPTEVKEALAKYVRAIKPKSVALMLDAKLHARETLLGPAVVAFGETICGGYELISRTIVPGGARGRQSSAAVRNVIFETLEQAPLNMRLRIARYMKIAMEEVSVHVSSAGIPDLMVDKLAIKFLAVGDLIRMKVVAEASRRGATAERWWDDMRSQVPARYADMKEGTMGWAKAAMWLTFREPTDKWANLVKAVHYRAVREAGVNAVGMVSLPPEKGSKDRILAAARAAVNRIASAYSGYYMAVADVGMSMADVLDCAGNGVLAGVMMEASYMWVLRARALRGTNVHLVAKDEPTPSQNHMRVYGPKVDVLVVPAPYRAYEAYRTHALASELIPMAAKKKIMDFKDKRISKLFESLPSPLLFCRRSTVTRYLLRPAELAHAMEKAWSELRKDVERVIEVYALEEMVPYEPMVEHESERVRITMSTRPLLPRKEVRDGYFDMLAIADHDEVDWFEDALADMDPVACEALRNRKYASLDEMRRVFERSIEDMPAGGMSSRETVW